MTFEGLVFVMTPVFLSLAFSLGMAWREDYPKEKPTGGVPGGRGVKHR